MTDFVCARHRSEALIARGLGKSFLVALCAAALLLSSCGRKQRRVTPPVSTRPVLPTVLGASEEGIASWYGAPYHGRNTANGEIYDQEKMTAAHPSLRFGAVVEVTNHTNGLRTRVRVNDRGPFVANRAIDLSRAAAREIAMLGPGTAPVRVEVVGLPGDPLPSVLPASREAPPPASQINESDASFAVQAGAFANRDNALALLQRLVDLGFNARITDPPNAVAGQGKLWRVLVGHRLSRLEAEELLRALQNDFPRIFLTPDH